VEQDRHDKCVLSGRNWVFKSSAVQLSALDAPVISGCPGLLTLAQIGLLLLFGLCVAMGAPAGLPIDSIIRQWA